MANSTKTKEKVLSPTQRQVLALMLSNPSLPELSRQSGVDVRTINRWLHADELFMGAYRSQTEKLFDGILIELVANATKSVRHLAQIADGRANGYTPRDRMNASIKIVELSIKAKELLANEARLREIERKLSQLHLDER